MAGRVLHITDPAGACQICGEAAGAAVDPADCLAAPDCPAWICGVCRGDPATPPGCHLCGNRWGGL